jgi:hypothetical protein
MQSPSLRKLAGCLPKLLLADTQKCATSLRLVDRTWPTSMDAVFRRLAHGVYTMLTLFSLQPWMLFCFTCVHMQ